MNKVIKDAIEAINKPDPVGEKEITQIDAIESLPIVEPCEISEEACEIMTEFYDKIKERQIQSNLCDTVTSINVELSLAEYKILSEKASEIHLDVASYLKFITLNAKTDIKVDITYIKSLYSHYYKDE